jgi:hypothetical protein
VPLGHGGIKRRRQIKFRKMSSLKVGTNEEVGGLGREQMLGTGDGH